MIAALALPWRIAACLSCILSVGHAAAQSSGLAGKIAPSGTQAAAAPNVPASRGGLDAGPVQYLINARMALHEGRTGAAQEALERAETRLLNSFNPGAAQSPDHSAMLLAATRARRALGAHDTARAVAILDASLATRFADAAPPGLPPPPMEAELAYPPQQGGWAWHGDKWVWAPGRSAQEAAPRWVPGRWVWQGSWVMTPGHWQ